MLGKNKQVLLFTFFFGPMIFIAYAKPQTKIECSSQLSETRELNTKIADLEKKITALKNNLETDPENIDDLHLQTNDVLQKNLPPPLYKKIFTSIKNFAFTVKSFITTKNTFKALILLAELYAVYCFLLKPEETPLPRENSPPKSLQNPAVTQVMSEFIKCLISFSPGTCDLKETYDRLNKEKANMSN